MLDVLDEIAGTLIEARQALERLPAQERDDLGPLIDASLMAVARRIAAETSTRAADER